MRDRSTPPSKQAVWRPARLQPPDAWLMVLEGLAPWKCAARVAAAPWVRRQPRADAHPVLLAPGIGTDNLTTPPLHRALDALGCASETQRQVINQGPSDGVSQRCAHGVCALAGRHGRAVSLVGWSLGGLYARELARELPQRICTVITLGTPVAGHPRSTRARRVVDGLNACTAHAPTPMARPPHAPPAPPPSIDSRGDGIVGWQCRVNGPGAMAQSVEVSASRSGTGASPATLCAIADRPGQRPGRCRPFDASGLRRRFSRRDAPRAAAAG